MNQEKEYLLNQLTAETERNEIQQESLNTSNDEIGKLLTTIDNFQIQCQSLENQIQKAQTEKEDVMKAAEEDEGKLIVNKDPISEQRLQMLRKECDEVREREIDMKAQFIQTLTKHQSSWAESRTVLNKRITDLEHQRVVCKYELKVCRDEILDREAQSKKIKEETESNNLESMKRIATLEVDALDNKDALQDAQQISESTLERIQELKSKLKSTNDEKEEIQSKHDACLQEQEYLKSRMIIIKDGKDELQLRYDSNTDTFQNQINELENKLQKNQRSETELNKSHETLMKLEENKEKALESTVDELNEAHIREGILEENLSSCQEELSRCKKNIESFEKQVCEEAVCTGVYKEMNTKLKKSNNILEKKNRNLTESISKLEESNEATSLALEESSRVNDEVGDDAKRENAMMKELLVKSQTAVTDSKRIQQTLSKEIEASSERERILKMDISMMKTKNEDVEKRLDDQEKELDEFENDFSIARNDARKVVEELRSQLIQLERQNQHLLNDGTAGKVEDLKNKLRQLIQQNKRLQKEIEYSKVRERRLEGQLGLEPKKKAGM